MLVYHVLSAVRDLAFERCSCPPVADLYFGITLYKVIYMFSLNMSYSVSVYNQPVYFLRMNTDERPPQCTCSDAIFISALFEEKSGDIVIPPSVRPAGRPAVRLSVMSHHCSYII